MSFSNINLSEYIFVSISLLFLRKYQMKSINKFRYKCFIKDIKDGEYS